MNAIVTNNLIVIQNPTPIVERTLNNQLFYRDKSKEYQLKRHARNPIVKKTSWYKKLQQEAQGNLLHKLPDGNLAVSSGFYYIIKGLVADIEDRRTDTGTTVPLPWKDKPHELRDYQRTAVDLMHSNRRGIINLATGLGKTLLAIHAIKEFRRNTLIVVPSDSIAQQFYTGLVDAFGDIKVGIYGGGKKKMNDITVGIAASVFKNADEFKKQDLGLIIVDECHHIPASTFYSIARKLGDVGHMFGLTATDYRSDGKDVLITGGCGDVIIRRDIRWGVENGWLSKPHVVMREIDTTGQPDCGNNKVKNYKSHVLNCQVTKDQILQDMQSYMNAGKQVMCLVDEIAHGKELSQLLGVPFATGKDKASQTYVDQMNSRKIMGLVGTDGKIGEGTNVKNIDVLILANFVASKGAVIQAVGRGLRRTPTKDKCLILDYCLTGSDMLYRHAKTRLTYYREITDEVQVI